MRMNVFLAKKIAKPKMPTCAYRALEEFKARVLKSAAKGGWLAADLTNESGEEIASWESAANPGYAIGPTHTREARDFAGGRLWVRVAVWA